MDLSPETRPAAPLALAAFHLQEHYAEAGLEYNRRVRQAPRRI